MAAWLATMAAAYRTVGVDADLCRAAALVGVAEGLLCGVTTVADHHLTWPPGADHLALAHATIGPRPSSGGAWCSSGARQATTPAAAARQVADLVATLHLGPGGAPRTGMLQLAVGPGRGAQRWAARFEALGRGGGPLRAAAAHPGQRAGRRRAGRRALRAPPLRTARRMGLAEPRT